MTISALPTIPSRGQLADIFNANADAFLAALPQFVTELNAMGTLFNIATTTTSATSNIIAIASKTFAVPTGLGFSLGMPLTIASTASPLNNMYGVVTAYAAGSLTVQVSAISGSGTFASWTISLAAASIGAGLGTNTFSGVQNWNQGINIASATTVDLTTSTGNTVIITGTTSISAWNIGSGSLRIVYFSSALQLTYNGTTNRLNSGGSNYSVIAGDWAIITKVDSSVITTIIRSDGQPVIPPQSVLSGTVIDFSGSAVPTGYLLCPTAPTTVSRTTYSALFIAIGTTWGIGDGSTTFNIPYYPADYASVQANLNVGTNHVGEVIAHTHTAMGTYALSQPRDGSAGQPSAREITVTTSSTGGSSNRAAGVRVLKCVKY